VVKVGMGKYHRIQLSWRNVYGKAYFMIDHDAIIHEDLARRCLYCDGGSSDLLACSEKP
jgi:hypothetical protein